MAVVYDLDSITPRIVDRGIVDALVGSAVGGKAGAEAAGSGSIDIEILDLALVVCSKGNVHGGKLCGTGRC